MYQNASITTYSPFYRPVLNALFKIFYIEKNLFIIIGKALNPDIELRLRLFKNRQKYLCFKLRLSKK